MARSRSSPVRKPAAKPAPAPAPVKSAPAPTPVQAGPGGGGLLGVVAEGMAFGTGSAIAHRAVGAVFGGSSSGDKPTTTAAPEVATATALTPPTASPPASCFDDQKAFMDCLQANKNDVSSCQFYFDQFNMCKNQTSSGYQALPF
ncbi:Aste57867_2732 [Aphanomyces stellatus]|uniref:Aste57867_2732 protein n=1 Tax=Aphanomyces stellatus TaxID=120398 RepID=A0A485K863_9STRA|nr:hypothetical protein As57867_002725 [Aphanomyces stellatus]VFT79924.1 Aste57867_2732 [Aphanomyces stellatus]